MAAEIHRLQPRPVAVNWMCSACGVDAGCNCGAPLMSKAQRAAEAVAANPRMSDRAIAEEIGVGNATVSRARRSTVSDDTVDEEPRVGLDGRARRMPVRREADEEFTPKELAARDRGSFLLRAQEAKGFAFYNGKVDRSLLEFAKATAAAWCGLVEKLEKEI